MKNLFIYAVLLSSELNYKKFIEDTTNVKKRNRNFTLDLIAFSLINAVSIATRSKTLFYVLTVTYAHLNVYNK